MRKTGCMLLVALLAMAMVPVATATETGPLTAQEILTWREQMAAELADEAVLNVPADTLNPEMGSGYLIEYDEGMITSTTPDTPAAANIMEVDITGGHWYGPRGLSLGSSLETLLESFLNENPSLTGDTERAILYAYGPGEYAGLSEPVYGVLFRDGDVNIAVQYTVMIPLENNQYVEVTLQYLLEDNYVSAVRVIGFQELITAEGMQEKIAGAKAAQALDTFSSDSAGQVADVLMLADLQFEGLFLPDASLQDVTGRYGQPEETQQMQEGETGTLLTYPGMEFEFTGAGETQRLASFTLMDESKTGPRGIYVGMDLADALALFRREEQPWDGNRMILYAYGDTTDTPPFGMMEYFTETEATLRYGVKGDDGGNWMLMMSIVDLQVDEILIYSYSD